jgi:TrmH family RNA methyltransferase
MSRPSRSSDDVAAVLRLAKNLSRPPIRRDPAVFWFEGVRHFIQAVDAKYEFEAIVYSPVLQPSVIVAMQIRRLKQAGVVVHRVSPETFREVSSSGRASGIGALARKRWTPLERIEPRRGLCLLAIEGIRSGGNLGTILRTAEACGVGGVLFIDPRSDPFDPDVVRSAMGGVFHLPLCRTTPAQLDAWHRRAGVLLVGLSPNVATLWTEMPTGAPICVVVGEERQGLSPQMTTTCDVNVRLPMSGRADSLNVGVAVGVALYELVRRTCV